MLDEEEVEECGEPYATKEGLCKHDGIFSDGKCGYHTDDDLSDYDPAKSGKHGLHKSNYYKDLPEDEKTFIDVVADNLLQKSYYTKEDKAMVKKCRQIAIDIHQKDRADGYISKKGMTQENTVGIHEVHGEITETAENTLFITKDRLSREARLSMKDLGVLDEDTSDNLSDDKTVLDSLSEDN